MDDAIPRVSIGLIVVTSSDFVAQALESRTRPNFARWELIISDNAATDGTRDIGVADAAGANTDRWSASTAR